jgi:hypothetical protein
LREDWAVPSGEYQVGAERERFSCAPGPAGWRYNATVLNPDGVARGKVDVVVDARWRQVRVELVRGAWILRGGIAGRETMWVRTGVGGEGAAEAAERAAGFFGGSPAFWITTARMLALTAGESATVALVEIAGDALAAHSVRHRWSLVEVGEHAAELRPLRVERYEVADLDTGVVAEVHMAGDVVLAAPDIELLALDGPPTVNSGSSA